MGNYFCKEEVKYTALHHAVICNNVDAAVSLMWRGCSIYDKDSSGETVMELCDKIGSDEMKNILQLYDERRYNMPRSV
jgi:ankyrin repeat protein